MRAFLILAACAVLAGCGGGAGWNGEAATYDALAQKRADCLAKGGELSLVNGGDPQVIGDFKCKRK